MVVTFVTNFKILRQYYVCKGCRLLHMRNENANLSKNRAYATTGEKRTTNASQYCLNTVKKYDYENFLAGLLLPVEARASAFAVRAFNIEIAQIQDITTQALMAKMRLQFWRETLDKIYMGNTPKQPVALELQRAVDKHKLSKRWLLSLIESRESHLENKQFASIQAVEDYSEKSNSAIYFLILQSLGVKNIHADHVASHLGKAEGITRLIRGVPHLGARRIVLLPRDVMMVHKVSQESIIRGKQDQEVKDVIFDIASAAHHHIEHAKDLMKDVPKNARIGLLSHVSVSAYLKALQLVHFDVFDSALQRRNHLLPLQLWWAKIKNL